MERLQERYICPNGARWEVWLAIYHTDRYDQGGRDEVLQYKQNGREVGYFTRHWDREGRLIHENYYGMTSVPEDARRI